MLRTLRYAAVPVLPAWRGAVGKSGGHPVCKAATVIRHVVLCHRRSGASEQEMTEIFKALEGLQAVIPGIISVSAGRDCSPEGLQSGMTHGFTVDFMDAAARDRYLEHPDHVAIGARLVRATEGGIDGLIVLDLAM